VQSSSAPVSEMSDLFCYLLSVFFSFSCDFTVAVFICINHLMLLDKMEDASCNIVVPSHMHINVNSSYS